MSTKTLTDTDSVQIITNKWLRDVRQYADNVDTLDKHGTINAALSNIGSSTQTTIVVAENIAVNANTDLTSYPNISWLMLGSGKLTPATGITLTLYSPDSIIAPCYQQVLDASSGTIAFYKAGWAHPGWFGARANNSASTNKTALVKLAAALGAVGGGIWWPGSTIQVDDTIAFTGPVQICGVHRDSSILESTAAASNKHGLTFTKSHTIKNLQVRTSTNLTANYTMKAISCDLDGVVSGGLENVYEHVKIRGFNIGIYGDGGANYNIDRSYFKNVDIQASGDGTTYIGSCMYQNRITQTHLTQVTLDQNNTGEHALYFFGCKDIALDDFKIRNATKTESQAVKLIGNVQDPTQTFNVWTVKNVDIENCTNGVLLQTYGAETLDSLHVENCRFVDIDGTTNIPGAVFVEAAGTSEIRQVRVDNCSFKDIGFGCVQYGAATSGGFFRHGVVSNCRAYNWSTSSTGTYTFFRTNGNGTYGPIHLENIEADGNSNGRTIVGTAGQASTITRISTRNLHEVNTATPGLPVTFTDGDATPSVAIGDDFIANNTSATSITTFDDMKLGQKITIRFANGNTTLVRSSGLNLAGAVNTTPTSDDIYSFRKDTNIYEVARSVN